ncbi:MAG: hypothetical protein KH230_07615 [Enterocloster asparagiformis]|nr:hypothetical protein [Enterocloster asparagiformis]
MENIFALLLTERRKEEVQRILKCNEMTQRYGLTLTRQEAGELMACRTDSLKESGRVELGESVLPAVIEAFCDSAYICQDNYVEVINRLQELFYLYKNESADQLTDGELLDFMRKQFDDICFGDLDYLGGTCLERFARAVRAGWQCGMQRRPRDEYSLRETDGDYGELDEETRWEYEIYRLKLENLD